MSTLDKLAIAPGAARAVKVGGAPEGLDALLIGDLARSAPHGLLHMARDDARLASMAEMLAFFAPEITVLTLPAWDCLPYDRVSPHTDISSRRMEVLSRLAADKISGPFAVITTISAALTRVPPRQTLREAHFKATAGERIDLAALPTFLERIGYTRAGTVMEPGEFAVRGGIVDIYPPGVEQPLRLDLFGDTVESVRVFDPLTQRTTGTREGMSLLPVSEVRLDEASIERFRSGYVSLFGAVTDDDPLYEAVSAGRKFAGLEHWLPLFHEKLETVFDYLPGAVVTLDQLADDALEARLSMIADYYANRKAAAGARDLMAAPYKPLPPEMLYLDGAAWKQVLEARTTHHFSTFKSPEGPGTVDAGGQQGRSFAPERQQPEINLFDAVGDHIRDLQSQDTRVLLAAYSVGSRERLSGVLADHGIQGLQPVEHWGDARALPDEAVGVAVLPLETGFVGNGIAVIGEQDILGDRLVRQAHRSRRAEDFLREASSLSQGDLVVHMDHGIGRYNGLETIDVAGAPHDCLHLVYDGGDKLYLPVENIEILSRYGSDTSGAALDRLGGSGWQARKAKLKKRIRDIADQLIKIAAGRALTKADRMPPPEGIYEEFCARFPYDMTEDQQRAVEEAIGDLTSGRLMDRLVCGDVGFGKTEIALRCALVVAMSGKQVAVVTPTTLLARQHHKTFCDRFAGLPVMIRQLSRMVTPGQAKETKEFLAQGQVDIIIGTHALLSKNIEFRDLGLLIIDEEQHFGVTHKEQLKNLKSDINVLTLTATPIPRTLQMALSGVRDLSLMATPPVDRLAVRTFVQPFDPLIVREAILREHFRGGQSFYVCPRISDLPETADFLTEHVPEVKFAVAHGQMPPSELEEVMSAFYEGSFDVLLSTTIIESGLDIPTANTLVVHRADRYGLAQLYQLRGRIGRSKVRGYAHLTVPANKPLTDSADKRLRVLQALDTLGAGFSLASHDLDIRGAGNLLGEEQSGQIREVGIELYQELLEQAVAEARTGGGEDVISGDGQWTPQISTGTSVLIPDRYVTDLDVRMSLYRRLASLEDRAQIDGFAAELIDRFGELPEEVDHLLKIVEIKALCRRADIEKVDSGPKGATIAFRNNSFADPAGLVEFITMQQGTAKVRPDHRLVLKRHWEDANDRLEGTFRLVQDLAKMADQAATAAPKA